MCVAIIMADPYYHLINTIETRIREFTVATDIQIGSKNQCQTLSTTTIKLKSYIHVYSLYSMALLCNCLFDRRTSILNLQYHYIIFSCTIYSN